MPRTILKNVLLAVALSLSAATSIRAQTNPNTPTTDNPTRIYMIGNSMMDQVRYTGFDALATTRGHDHAWGRQMIAGAPIQWMWEHPNDGNTITPYDRYPNALTNYAWEAIVLNPTDRHIHQADGGGDAQMTINFMNYALPASPDAQFYILQRTPRRSGPAEGPWTIDYPAVWLRQYVTTGSGSIDTTFTRDFYRQLIPAIQAIQPAGSKPIKMIPVGDAMFEIDFRIKHGQIPGMSDINEVYSDGSHYTNIGAYIQALAFYATIYDDEPLGLSVPSQYGTIAPELARALQQAVGDVVANRAPGLDVPEPSAGAMLIGSLAAISLRRRRRAA